MAIAKTAWYTNEQSWHFLFFCWSIYHSKQKHVKTLIVLTQIEVMNKMHPNLLFVYAIISFLYSIKQDNFIVDWNVSAIMRQILKYLLVSSYKSFGPLLTFAILPKFFSTDVQSRYETNWTNALPMLYHKFLRKIISLAKLKQQKPIGEYDIQKAR